MLTTEMIKGLKHFEGLGIKVWHDSIMRPSQDNVMGIFYEEQVLTWKLIGDKLLETVGSAVETISFLDVGTGSGFWAILSAKELQKRGSSAAILAIDNNSRAVEVCEQNMIENNVRFDLKYEAYSINCAPMKDVRVIFMNPPYHIYPVNIENWVPSHARGGSLGFEEFANWLKIADQHLANGGRIFFHHMCLGNEFPEFLKFIPEFISGNPSIHYFEIFPALDTSDFLIQIYGNNFVSFIQETADRFHRIFFTSGEIIKDGLGSRTNQMVPHDLLAGKSWFDRITLHQQIAQNAEESMKGLATWRKS